MVISKKNYYFEVQTNEENRRALALLILCASHITHQTHITHHASRITHHSSRNDSQAHFPWPKWRQWSISDSLYLRSRMYRILWRNPLGQLITRSNTDVTIGIDWQPNPWSMVSGKLGVTEHMLIEHGVFSAWQEYKRVFVAMRLSPMDTWQKKNVTITCCSVVAFTASQ